MVLRWERNFLQITDLAHPDNSVFVLVVTCSLVPTQLYELLKSKHGIRVTDQIVKI